MMNIQILDPEKETEAIIRLWNEAMGPSFPLDDRLFMQQWRLERSPRLFLGARRHDGSLAGAMLAKRNSRLTPEGSIPPTGSISFILVAQGERRAGLGTELLGSGEAWLKQNGVRRVRAGADTWHLLPGIPLEPGFEAARAFVQERGYVPGNPEHDMARDLGLTDTEKLTPPIAPGYSVRFYSPELREATESFFTRCFPGRWKKDTLELLDNGMRHKDLLLLVHESEGRVAGFAHVGDRESRFYAPGLYWRGIMGSNPGALGPIGIDEQDRGKKLGLHLLGRGLAELKSRGCRHTVIDWTDLTDFYALYGFSIWKSYLLHEKNLT